MKTLKLFSILIITLFIIQTNIFTTITSRIEGKVVDIDSGHPVPYAKVYLFNGVTSFVMRAQQKSDMHGKFKIDDLNSGNYFLVIKKEKYLIHSPISEDRFDEYIESPVLPNLGEAKDKTFFLQEGQIKHIIIKLEKAAFLKVSVFRKLPSGTVALEWGTPYSIRIINSESKEIFYDQPAVNLFTTKGLPEGTVKMKVNLGGYPEREYQNILLRKGVTTDFSCVFDFSVGQVLHGFVKSKETGYPLVGAIVDMTPVYEGASLYTETDANGKFWFGGFKPGLYKITSLPVIKKVEIKLNEIKQIIILK